MQLKTKYHESFETLHVGTEVPRAYYIPCGFEPDFKLIDAKNVSDQVFLLNGIWKFKLFGCYEFMERESFLRFG